MYKTYKYYNSKGNHLSIFGQTFKDHINIVIIQCSKQDLFSKKIANDLYSQYLSNTEDMKEIVVKEYNTLIIDNKPGKSFINWCETNYYKEKTEYRVFTRRTLVKYGEPKQVPITKFKISATNKISQRL